MDTEQLLLEIHGKVEATAVNVSNILSQQKSAEDKVTKLHTRVDGIEDKVAIVETDQKLFKRDIRWIVAIGLAIIAITKWLVGFFK
jgi:tetrahydromethanopterin S-methyltransferase subunit G